MIARVSNPRPWFTLLVATAVASGMRVRSVQAEELGAGQRGEELYRTLCAECHGPNGEGAADLYDEPLFGDRTVDELTQIIEETMPEEEPEACVGQEAQVVAAYIYDAFYSPAARRRNSGVRVEIARLTAEQHQNALADALAEFLGRGTIGEEPGLRAEYYDARNSRRNKQVLARIDRRIAFDYGAGSPDPEAMGFDEFSIRWRGSVVIEETGDYQFAVRSENGVRLWVNDEESALIDGWVASGGEVREHQAVRRLLGGRAYPLRLDFFKYKDKTASIELLWKPPGKAWEVIPDRNLRTDRGTTTFVTTADFPPDDASAGYERGVSVSRSWDDAATAAAIETANYVADRLTRLAEAPDDAEDRIERIGRFCARFAAAAFRRPITDDERTRFVDAPLAGIESNESDAVLTAVKRSVILVLKSPRFLYPKLASPPGVEQAENYQVASRLALALWDSGPDAALRAAAAAGELSSPEQIERQARRMLADGRARAKLRGFFHDWLQLEEGEDAAKDAEAFPGFNEELVADLRTSLELFLDDVVWGDDPDYRRLLLDDYWFVNRRLAEFYDLPAPEEETFAPVSFDSDERAGVVTHPFLLTALAYHKSTSPIHRGVFATRRLLGRSLKPPPMAIEFMDGRFDPHLTMREKVAELTADAACQTCHRIINPLGFSLERFDAVGRLREEDAGRPVDSAADYPDPEGGVVRLNSGRDLAQYAAETESAQRAFVQQLFHHLVKQPAEAYAPDLPRRLTDDFRANDYHIRDLMVAIAAAAAAGSENE